MSHLRRCGVGADVASGGELETVLRAGFDPAAIAMTGPGKRDEELAAAERRYRFPSANGGPPNAGPSVVAIQRPPPGPSEIIRRELVSSYPLVLSNVPALPAGSPPVASNVHGQAVCSRSGRERNVSRNVLVPSM